MTARSAATRQARAAIAVRAPETWTGAHEFVIAGLDPAIQLSATPVSSCKHLSVSTGKQWIGSNDDESIRNAICEPLTPADADGALRVLAPEHVAHRSALIVAT